MTDAPRYPPPRAYPPQYSVVQYYRSETAPSAVRPASLWSIDSVSATLADSNVKTIQVTAAQIAEFQEAFTIFRNELYSALLPGLACLRKRAERLGTNITTIKHNDERFRLGPHFRELCWWKGPIIKPHHISRKRRRDTHEVIKIESIRAAANIKNRTILYEDTIKANQLSHLPILFDMEESPELLQLLTSESTRNGALEIRRIAETLSK